jgi:alkylation response protein AidB-like acyl-CoA dehydrogenase
VDFSWTKQQAKAYAGARDYGHAHQRRSADGQLRPIDMADWALLARAGIPRLCIPVAYGGEGFDAQTTARAVEGFAYGCDDMGLVFSACAHLFACAMPIAEHGSTDLSERYLKRLADGSLVGANAITEVDAGSDVWAMTTMATSEGDKYRITGTKSYVTNAPLAGCFLVYAVTSPADGYLGVTAFVVDRDTPGVEVGLAFEKRGLSSAPAASVEFDGCLVDGVNRVGAEGQGAAVFRSSMVWERTCLFAMYLGQMDRQLDAVLRHVKSRCQFGRPLARMQTVAHSVADMKLRLEAARLLLYRACWLKDEGEDAMAEIAMAKLAVSEGAVQSALDAVQLFGSTGTRSAEPIGSAVWDALPGTVFSGVSGVQRDMLARSLGL